jgi:hypothetical protein
LRFREAEESKCQSSRPHRLSPSIYKMLCLSQGTGYELC